MSENLYGFQNITQRSNLIAMFFKILCKDQSKKAICYMTNERVQKERNKMKLFFIVHHFMSVDTWPVWEWGTQQNKNNISRWNIASNYFAFRRFIIHAGDFCFHHTIDLPWNLIKGVAFQFKRETLILCQICNVCDFPYVPVCTKDVRRFFNFDKLGACKFMLFK